MAGRPTALFDAKQPRGLPLIGVDSIAPLLASAQFVTVKRGQPGAQKQHRLPLAQVVQAVSQCLSRQAIDLVIDFESSGIQTFWLTRRIAKEKQALSVGIAQFPRRWLFYDRAAAFAARAQRLLSCNSGE